MDFSVSIEYTIAGIYMLYLYVDVTLDVSLDLQYPMIQF